MTPVNSRANGYAPANYVEHDRFSETTENLDEAFAEQRPIAPAKRGSEERRELRNRISELKVRIGMEHVRAQEPWLQEIKDIASGKRTEGVHRPSLASVSDVSIQERNQEEPVASSELTNVELKTLGRSLSNWATLGLIHHFSILGGSPNRNLDFGQVSGMIGRTRTSENPEKDALDLYIAYCAETLEWGYFQTAFQTMWIKASHWVLSGVMPVVIERTFEAALNKIRSKSKEAGNFDYVSWKLVEHLEAFLKRDRAPSADGPTVNAEELKALCDGLSPFLMSEFFPKLTLCEDRLKTIPFLSFFSVMCRPIDALLNAFIRYSVGRSLPGLLKKGIDALERLIGGKEGEINYRIANPILNFINGKLEYFLGLIKNPSPEPSSPPPAAAQKKLKPLADELMKLSKVPCLDVEIKEYIRSILESSPSTLIKEKLQLFLDNDCKGEELLKQVQDLSVLVRREWDEEIGDHLFNLAQVPPVKERIRDEIRSGVIKGVYSLMQYLQKEQVQEVILEKTLNLATTSLFSESQASSPPEAEIRKKFMDLIDKQKTLFQNISGSLVDSVVDVMASKWIYINSDKQVNHHWSTKHATITGYLDAGISDKIISLSNALDAAKEESNDLEAIQFLEVLSKHLVFFEGLCDVLQAATQGAPPKSRQKIKESFNWLYQEVDSQIDIIADLKREWDSCVVRRDLKALYSKMHQELDKKKIAYNQAKDKDSAKGFRRVVLQMQELTSRVPTSEEESFDITSMANTITDLIKKEIELKESSLIFVESVEQSEIETQEKVLKACVNIVGQSKEMCYTAQSVNAAFDYLKEKIENESDKYGNRAQKSRQNLIGKAGALQAGHEERLEKIRKIQCDKIPPSAREAWGVGNWVASAIRYLDPVGSVNPNSVNAIGSAKQALSNDLTTIVDALRPLVIADPIEPSPSEAVAGAQPVINPLPRKNLYTDVERLTLSGLLSYYQSQAH